MSKPRVVILGGGFAGVYTALELERAQKGRDDFEIALVNTENYFVFQPMLPEVISGTIGLTDVVSPLRHLLPRTDLHVRDVEAIDLPSKTVALSAGFRPDVSLLRYDHLVIAMGTVTDFRGMRGLPDHAMPFKNLGDALSLRNHVIHALEEASIEKEDLELRRQLLTFVVAGGGFSGVEVVAELNDFVRDVAPSYRGIDPQEVKVYLLHATDRILPEMDASLALFAQRILTERGVELRLNTRLEAASGTEALLLGGERIPTRTLVSTVPAFAHPLVETLALPKTKNNKLHVDRGLKVQGTTDVWALGDCAAVPSADGGLCPPTAQHATRQAAVAAHNILTVIRGTGTPRTFDFKGLGKMGSLGRRSAVAEILGMKVSGFLAWWMWRTVYLMKMPGWGRRLKVAISWTLDLVLPPELVQLKLGTSRGIDQEHFEPGQEIFEEGELGDRVYIILSGRASIEKKGVGVLAELGPGECFGEMALLNQSRRNATARCTEAMDVLALPKREFTTLAAHLPEMRKSFEAVAQRRAAAPHPAAPVPGGPAASA